MCAGAGDKEVEVAFGGPHLVGALPDEESVQLLPQGGEDSDVLSGHTLVQQDGISNRRVSSGPADHPLEA